MAITIGRDERLMPQALLIDSDILTSVDVDLAIADGAGEYLRKFRKSHALSIGDAVIAATAKEMGVKLVTRNIKHYPMKDVEIVKPY